MSTHPVRASLALGTLALVGYLLIVGTTVPDALWAFLGVAGTFYFLDKD